MVNELLTYAIMILLTRAAHKQFVIMVTKSYKMLSDEITLNANNLKQEVFVVQQEYHSPIRMNCTKNYGCESLTFLLL